MKPFALFLILFLAPAFLGGCSQSAVGYFVQEIGTLFSPPAKTKPVLSLADADVLLVVDLAHHDLAVDHPRLGLLAAQSLAHEMTAHHAARHVTDPNDLAAYARSRPDDFSQLALVDLGRHFKAGRVIHVVVENYRLESNPGEDSFNALIAVTLRVIDVDKGVQLYPELEGETELKVQSTAGVTAATPLAAEKILLDALALKISQLFVPYEVDKLPLHPEVQ